MTIVWLGSQGHTLSSEELKGFAQLAETLDLKVEPQLQDNDPSVCQFLDGILDWISEKDYEQLTSLAKFLTHPWFQRAWVVQEVAAARDIGVVWEGGYCDWVDLRCTWDLVQCLFRRALDSTWRSSKVVILLGRAKNTAVTTVNESRHPLKSICLTNFILHMMMNGQTKATRPEDLVYSVLGIVSDGDACGIEIDYSKHYASVYAEVALLFLKDLGAYGLVLSGQLDRGSDDDGFRLPSWVPDLRLKYAPTIYWHSSISSISSLFSATGHSLFEYSVDEKCEVLSVYTHNVDSVVEVSTIFDYVGLGSDDLLAKLSAKQTWLKTFAFFLKASLERYPKRYDHPAREDMPWRIPIADWHFDRVMGFGMRAGPEDKRGYTALLHLESGLVGSEHGDHQAYLGNLQLFENICFVTKPDS